jgi:copper transport protein
LGRRLLVVGLALALALYPRAAAAHALLLGSDPPPDAVLAAPPAAVSLTFSETVIPVGKAIQVFSPSGRQVAGPARTDSRVLTAPVSATENGTYVVSWQALATDTHPSRGAFRFVVGQPSSNPYSPLLSGGEIGTATPSGFALQALARWMHFLGLALTFGTVAYQVATRRDPRLRRLVVAGVALLIAAEPVALVAQLASLSFDGDTAIAVLASGFGRLLGLRLGVAFLVWALLALESPWPVLGLGGVMALIDGAGAHAFPGLPGAGLVVDAIHVAAMAIWVGGLGASIVAPDRRFRPYSIVGLAVAIGSGLVLALAHLGSPVPLVTTAYGWVLVVKATIITLLLSLPVFVISLPRVRGRAGRGLSFSLLRHRRRVGVGAAALVLALAAVLVSLPPPR